MTAEPSAAGTPGGSSGPSSEAGLSAKQREELAALNCTVSHNMHGRYCVPLSSRHRPAARKILAHEVHEPRTIAYITSHCDDGDVVHAGTYFGDFLPALSKGVAPGARVWAFEPNPENHRCARMTLELNGITNTTLTNTGLGSRQDSRLLRTSDAEGLALGGASRIIARESGETAGAEVVRMVTVDEVVGPARKVSILHLDVEGHEQEALSGALNTIRRCRPVLILEVLPGSTLIGGDWFTDNVLCLGYAKTTDVHRNSVFSCKARDGGNS